MKLWRVISLFTLMILWGIFWFITIPSVFGQTETVINSSQKDWNSISQYYQSSKSNSLSIEQRIQNINSFLDGAKLLENDSLLYNGLMQKTWLLSKAKQYDSAIFYSKKLHELAIQNRDTFYIKNALLKLGIYYKKNDDLRKSFEFYNENFKISRKLNDTLRAGTSLLQMANIQTFFGDYFGSKTTAIDGVKYLENTKDLKSLSGLFHIISVANRHQKKYKEAKRYNRKALNLITDSLSSYKIGLKNVLIFKNTEALILANEQNYDSSISILKSLVSDSVVKKNPKEYARVLGNLGYVIWSKNPEDPEAIKLLDTSLHIREEIDDIEGLVTSNIYLTKYYINNDKSQALKHAENAFVNAKKWNSLAFIIESLGFIVHLKDNVTKEARVFNETQSNREIYAVTKYENENLTNQNLILEADNAKLAVEKAKEERENVIYGFGSLLLIIIGVSLFYFLRQRHKRQRIRAGFDAENRISKKLHDELANDVYHVMTQLKYLLKTSRR